MEGITLVSCTCNDTKHKYETDDQCGQNNLVYKQPFMLSDLPTATIHILKSAAIHPDCLILIMVEIHKYFSLGCIHYQA